MFFSSRYGCLQSKLTQKTGCWPNAKRFYKSNPHLLSLLIDLKQRAQLCIRYHCKAKNLFFTLVYITHGGML